MQANRSRHHPHARACGAGYDGRSDTRQPSPEVGRRGVPSVGQAAMPGRGSLIAWRREDTNRFQSPSRLVERIWLEGGADAGAGWLGMMLQPGAICKWSD
jgi:hypothetical protein